MRIIFTSDYIGRETAMKQYHSGDVAEISFAQAIELIRLGCAEAQDDEAKPEIVEKPKRRKVKHENSQ